MKRKPRWTFEMFTISLAGLCVLMVLAMLVVQPTVWPLLLMLVIIWGICFGVFRHKLRNWVARWMCGGDFEKSLSLIHI